MSYLISGYTGGAYVGKEYVGGEIVAQEVAGEEARALGIADRLMDRDDVEYVEINEIVIDED